MTVRDASRRLFVALMAGDDVGAAIEGQRREWQWPIGARLTDPETLHTTLHFLGEVAAAQEKALMRALQTISMAPCELRLRAGTIWAGGIAALLVDPCGALSDLHAAVGQGLDRLGVRADRRPWVPHLTLARHAQGATPPASASVIEWRATHFSLVWSRPAPLHGYMPVATWPSCS